MNTNSDLLPAGAEFSPCRQYRYTLWRIWDQRRPLVMCIGLNPSTANANKNDNTINILMRVLKELGFGGFYMTNLFAWISSDPEILVYTNAVGERNDEILQDIASQCDTIIACWGTFKQASNRIVQVAPRFQGRLKCFGVNQDGTPFHPRALSYKGLLNKAVLINYHI